MRKGKVCFLFSVQVFVVLQTHDFITTEDCLFVCLFLMKIEH